MDSARNHEPRSENGVELDHEALRAEIAESGAKRAAELSKRKARTGRDRQQFDERRKIGLPQRHGRKLHHLQRKQR